MMLFLSGCVLTDSTAEQNTTYVYPPWKHTWGVVRGTPLKLRLLVGNKTHFNDPQGIAVVRLDVWDDSTKTGDDDEITAYGVNSGDNCIIYNKSMYALGIYGLDDDHQKLSKPWGIAADASGRVYVVDSGNSRVVRLFNSGDKLEYVSSLGGLGDADGMFFEPKGVALDPQGNVYVTDAGLGRVTVFDDSGKVIQIWDDFDGPDGIAVVGVGEKWTYRPKETFAVVIDSLHDRVRKLSLDGELLAETDLKKLGVVNGFLAYVTLDYYNQLIITDKRNNCLYKLDTDLNLITKFGEYGTGDYQYDQPRGIAIYRHFGQLIIAERLGAQYMWVAVDVTSIEAKVVKDSLWQDLRVDFTLTEPAFCEMDILDSYGRFVSRLSTSRRFMTGAGFLSWDLRVPKQSMRDVVTSNLPDKYVPGELLPVGEYTVRARFRATYSSRKHFSKEVSTHFKMG
jgi:hypothetical protein